MSFLFRIHSPGPLSLLVSLKFYAVLALWGYFVRRLWRVSRGEPWTGPRNGPQIPHRPPAAAAARGLLIPAISRIDSRRSTWICFV